MVDFRIGGSSQTSQTLQRLTQLNRGLNTAVAGFISSSASLDPSTIRKIQRGPDDLLARTGLPPWEDQRATLREFSKSDTEKLSDITKRKSLLEGGERIRKPGKEEDEVENLFTLHKALDRLNALTDYLEKGQQSSVKSSLRKQFDREFAELNKLIGETKFSEFKLIRSLASESATSNVLVNKRQTFFHGQTVALGSATPAGITGTETFTINFQRQGFTANQITVDLSETTDHSMNGIVNLINQKIKDFNEDPTNIADGKAILTTVDLFSQQVGSDDNFQGFKYGIKLLPGLNETTTFTAPTSTPTIQVAGTSDNATQDTFLRTIGATETDDLFNTTFDSTKRDQARAIATDSNGNTFTLTNTNGNVGLATNTTGTTDVMLSKYDQAGRLVFQRTLGASDTTTGNALTIDANNNVIVTGTTFGTLSSSGGGGSGDTFVTKFTNTGEEVFTRQVGTSSVDGGLSVKTDSSGNIFVAGFVAGALSGETSSGGNDAYVTKLSSTGSLVYNNQFGTANGDSIEAITVDNAGNVIVARNSNGTGFVDVIPDADGATASQSYNLGSMAAGSFAGIAFDGTEVIVAGNTIDGTIGSTTNGGITGSQVGQAYQGGVDGFVTRINFGAGTASTTFVGTTGTANNDRITALSLSGTNVVVAGNTDGELQSGVQGSASAQDGFVRSLDNTGAALFTRQFGGNNNVNVAGVSVSTSGDNVLTRLGLPSGTPFTLERVKSSDLVTEQSVALSTTLGIRPNSTFQLAVNGGSKKTITLDENDTIQGVAIKLNEVLKSSGRATVENDVKGLKLKITAFDGGTIELFSGPKGFDALGEMGLREGKLFGTSRDPKTGAIKSRDDIFALGITDNISVKDAQSAGNAGLLLNSAKLQLRKAYDKILDLPPLDTKKTPQQAALNAQQQKQINSLNTALAKLQQFSAAQEAQQLVPGFRFRRSRFDITS